jgi:hypothetical protein
LVKKIVLINKTKSANPNQQTQNQQTQNQQTQNQQTKNQRKKKVQHAIIYANHLCSFAGDGTGHRARAPIGYHA